MRPAKYHKGIREVTPDDRNKIFKDFCKTGAKMKVMGLKYNLSEQNVSIIISEKLKEIFKK